MWHGQVKLHITTSSHMQFSCTGPSFSGDRVANRQAECAPAPAGGKKTKKTNSCRGYGQTWREKQCFSSCLHKKICSLPQHTLNSKSCHSFSFYLKLLEQITIGGSSQLLEVFMIKLWQYLTSWNNKSVIMACFPLALIKKNYHSVFINICLPVFRRVFFHWYCAAQIFLYWNSLLLSVQESQLSMLALLKPHLATHSCSCTLSRALPGTITILQLVTMEYLRCYSLKVKCLARGLLSRKMAIRDFSLLGPEF